MTPKLKLLYVDQSTREEFDKDPVSQKPYTELRVCHGYDILVHFPDEEYFELTTDPLEAEAVVICCGLPNVTLEIDPSSNELIKELEKVWERFPNIKLFYDISHLFHMGPGCSETSKNINAEYFYEYMQQTLKISVLSLHTNLHAENLERETDGLAYRYCVFTDAIFNRVYSLYCHQPDRIFDAKMKYARSNSWYPHLNEKMRKESFELTDLSGNKFINEEAWPNNQAIWKSFVSMNRIRFPDLYYSELTNFSDYNESLGEIGQYPYRVPATRDFLRVELTKILQNYPGFLGDASKGNFLIGHRPTNEDLDMTIGFMGPCSIVPLHHQYYYCSALTIGIETNIHKQEYGFALTEKTFEPFLKGHIPLIYSSPEFYKVAQNYYGFKMPDWVNLDFDWEHNDLERWIKFVLEVKRLLNLGPQELHRLRRKDLDILKHNQSMIVETGYRKPITELTDQFFSYNKLEFPNHKKQ